MEEEKKTLLPTTIHRRAKKTHLKIDCFTKAISSFHIIYHFLEVSLI